MIICVSFPQQVHRSRVVHRKWAVRITTFWKGKLEQRQIKGNTVTQKLFLKVDHYSVVKNPPLHWWIQKIGISLDQLPFKLLEKEKEKSSELLLLSRMSLSCQVCNYYFPMAELQNNYSGMIILRRRFFFGSSHEAVITPFVVWKGSGCLTYCLH